MIEVMLLAYALTWLFTEARYAAMGKPSPRMQLKMERSRSGRYTTKDWAHDFMGDFLKDVTARRRELRAEKVADRAETARQSRAVDEAMDEAVAITKPNVQKQAPAVQETPVATGAGAQVIPINRTKEVAPVSYDEGQFLTSAIAHCEATARAHDNHSDAGASEDFLAGLQGAGVHGAPLAAVAAAQEASSNAAGAWRVAAAELKKGLTVKEAYEGARGAGNRDHVTGGE